jgi:hypothetical protein
MNAIVRKLLLYQMLQRSTEMHERQSHPMWQFPILREARLAAPFPLHAGAYRAKNAKNRSFPKK